MRIASLRANVIIDSRGESTVEATVFLESGVSVSASVPQGKSKGVHEAVYIEPALACANVEKEISSALCARDWNSAEEIDRTLIALDGTENKSRLGANAILAVSVAAGRAQAKFEELPLWKHIQERAGKKELSFPLLFINMIEGGLHSASGLLIQEFLVIPKSRSPHLALEAGRSFYNALGKELEKRFGKIEIGDEGGYAPHLSDEEEPFRIFDSVQKECSNSKGFEYGYDAAASNIKIPDKELFGLHERITKDFPISFIEDPFGEEKFSEFARLRAMLGERAIIAGDDLTVSDSARIRFANARNSINCVIIKPNQIGTLTEAIEATRLAESFGWKVVVSHRSGETTDNWIADFAVGVGAHGFKLGAPSRPERLAKYERLLAIESEVKGSCA